MALDHILLHKLSPTIFTSPIIPLCIFIYYSVYANVIINSRILIWVNYNKQIML